jgi:ribonucleoside-diphosphate reductase alpha chain
MLSQDHQEDTFFDNLHREKYRDKHQSFVEHAFTMASNMSSSDLHCEQLEDMFMDQAFLPAGRVQAAMGASEREVSAFNCSVSMTIEDDMSSIMQAASNAAKILRLGTGVGYNFSNLRPKGALIRKLQTEASGPLSFMSIFEAVASTIASSGHRRGAQMGILNVSHPDVEKFIDAKLQHGALRHFNISVGISDDFMQAVKKDHDWPLQFEGVLWKTIPARYLWDKIMRNAYDSAEPGVIFLDRINKQNNLAYCETIEATNPCSEQPLPANGLCLLGSFNLVKYVNKQRVLELEKFKTDIHAIVEAYDNIFDATVYAIPEHEVEAKNKRRIGIGLTGIANALELLTESFYGDDKFNKTLDLVARTLRDECYRASVSLARERGSFPLLEDEEHVRMPFIKSLPSDIRDDIYHVGIRNSHLISYAPCGTISLVAGNVSSGVEPVFAHSVKRDVHMKDGKVNVEIRDYNVRNHGLYGRALEECSLSNHISVAAIAQRYCDSSVSKTINVPSAMSFEQYKQVYMDAYDNGSKGITVFRPTELRGSVISAAASKADASRQQQREYRYGEAQCSGGLCTV